MVSRVKSHIADVVTATESNQLHPELPNPPIDKIIQTQKRKKNNSEIKGIENTQLEAQFDRNKTKK